MGVQLFGRQQWLTVTGRSEKYVTNYSTRKMTFLVMCWLLLTEMLCKVNLCRHVLFWQMVADLEAAGTITRTVCGVSRLCSTSRGKMHHQPAGGLS